MKKWFQDYSISISWSLVLLLLILNSALSYYNFRDVVESDALMARTYEQHHLTQQLLTLLVDAETGHRGFVITNEPEYLEPYEKALAQLPRHLQLLRTNATTLTISPLELDKVETTINLKVNEMKEILALRKTQGFEAARKRILENQGKKYMDEIRSMVMARNEQQSEQISKQHIYVDNSRTRAIAMLLAGAVLTLGMVIAAFTLIRRQLRFRAGMEAELRQLNSELEQRVSHRTEALLMSNESLRDEIEERKRLETLSATFATGLQRSNRELEQFASVASHDLQEPLRKIQAFSDRLSTKYHAQLDETGKEYIDRIQSSASRMRRLIEDLLAFSRVSSKGKPFTPVDLNKLVREVGQDLEVRLQETHAQLHVESLPTIEADELQMRQLFQNLISNSLKFIRADVQPQLTLSCQVLQTTLPDERTWCEISLKDNGIGFEQEYAERIFQLFQRLHSRNEYEGTGMGLAICKKIVERHEGTITAFGQPAQGATFVLRLPLTQTHRQED